MRPLRIGLVVATATLLVMAGVAMHPRPPAPTRLELHPASAIVQAPAYYRPVIAFGKTFPLARSNYLSYLEFPNNWHAPRLRLVNGKWLLIGVHEGIDISAERGTPILSMEPGVVENVGWTF
jgi:murein DD-endopeptidase MepM/ murein hydrolase activator NlpD